ncbi:8085_t:CDS:2 [Diversispora eburnea]|uniref:8085_t:CDS:1 n=1 Tax=Diversispora eburnea TaxID=1213867 RepID=A0A9N8W6B4_9GLOM|nr:8085_t:CDS:2 [Diversispora eburnea]
MDLSGKTKKSTFYDKYEPSDTFTKVAKGTVKIITFINNSIPDDFDEILNTDNDKWNYYNINEKIENLNLELQEQQKILTVMEYNKKRKHQKTIRLIDDEDIAEECLNFKKEQLHQKNLKNLLNKIY